ncbi:NAD(P)/FAD-dependent oxidoreductase [Pseudomonas sp. B21-054]|uniref:NAD(P)/FAD-dependent oxidoreductase n=1 Tax=Pseudomonas sp. B21-054 TaxID=2895494 RepID=UPI00223275AE|nr:FAD-binding oxidoreductase [Pseudomonas sp. B21-054]UZE16026.1 FAD-binding oxidoreductase [Pseudomonas sp. B21-054]
MASESFWLDTAPPFIGAAQGPVEGIVDVVVVGAGFTGLSAALALAKRDASVVVLEAGRIVGEASGRNGGHCNTGVSQDYAGLVQQRGREVAKGFYQAYADAVKTVRTLIEREGIDCELRITGKLKLAAKPKHYDAIARSCELIQRDVDPDVCMISAHKIRDEVDADGFFGGMLQANGAQMHMGKFGVGLGEAAVRNGARVFEQAAVTGIERLPNGNHLLTSTRGVIEARQVLVATGGSMKGPFQWFRRRIAPVGSFVIATKPLPDELLDQLLPKRRTYVTSRIVGNYFRTTVDNRLVFGGRARFAMSNPRSDIKSGKILESALAGMFPALNTVGIDYCWGGIVDMTADRLPRAGEHDGLFYAMGYSGHGVQMSVHMGQIMADVLEGKVESNPWRALDWPAIPGHFGKPWFLPLVGAYYKLQDRWA